MELVVLYLALAAAGAFGINKGVEVLKHNETMEADRYAQCVRQAAEVRECRSLE